jgi:hypothetical protein
VWHLWRFGTKPGRGKQASSALVGPRTKIARSRQHILNLEGEIQRFLGRNPCRVVVKQGSHAHQHRWVAEVREDVPPELAVVIGDAVHNARAALDLLACACVEANGRSANGVYFPIQRVAKRLGDVDSSIKLAHIPRADSCREHDG